MGARACLVVESSEIFCANTDEKGAYALMDSPLAVRISAKGFYRKTVTPADHEAPIVLEWAAVLHVIVVDDRTGRSVSTSEVQVTYESGARLGPFAADGDGLRIATTPLAMSQTDDAVAVSTARYPIVAITRTPLRRIPSAARTESLRRRIGIPHRAE